MSSVKPGITSRRDPAAKYGVAGLQEVDLAVQNRIGADNGRSRNSGRMAGGDATAMKPCEVAPGAERIGEVSTFCVAKQLTRTALISATPIVRTLIPKREEGIMRASNVRSKRAACSSLYILVIATLCVAPLGSNKAIGQGFQSDRKVDMRVDEVRKALRKDQDYLFGRKALPTDTEFKKVWAATYDFNKTAPMKVSEPAKLYEELQREGKLKGSRSDLDDALKQLKKVCPSCDVAPGGTGGVAPCPTPSPKP